MAAITEDYVSFEIAKLLKGKGFDSEDCFAFYKKNGEIGFLQTFGDITDYYSETCVIAPTIQMAMKWLREVHNIAIVITPSMFWGKYNASIYKKGNDYPYGFDGDSLVSSYEKAVENAIKYCLENLI